MTTKRRQLRRIRAAACARRRRGKHHDLTRNVVLRCKGIDCCRIRQKISQRVDIMITCSSIHQLLRRTIDRLWCAQINYHENEYQKFLRFLGLRLKKKNEITTTMNDLLTYCISIAFASFEIDKTYTRFIRLYNREIQIYLFASPMIDVVVIILVMCTM
jgi:hypothetical protein